MYSNILQQKFKKMHKVLYYGAIGKTLETRRLRRRTARRNVSCDTFVNRRKPGGGWGTQETMQCGGM